MFLFEVLEWVEEHFIKFILWEIWLLFSAWLFFIPARVDAESAGDNLACIVVGIIFSLVGIGWLLFYIMGKIREYLIKTRREEYRCLKNIETNNISNPSEQ